MTVIANRYEIQERLGAGGMGEVYRAYDRLTDQVIALKQVLVTPTQLAFNSQSTIDDDWLALAREFKILASLRHPHIISVLDYGFTADRIPYFTMEYLADAQNILQAATDFDEEALIGLIIQLLQGLAYLHQRGLLHRDLKPANVMFHNKQVKMIDFGLAIELSQIQRAAGTIAYLAPEQFDNHPASVATDLYAVGLIAYQLFLKKYPFETTRSITQLILAIVHDPIDCSELPLSVRPIIEKLLAKNPQERYTSAYDAMQAFSQAINQQIATDTALIRESFLQASSFVGRQTELQVLRTSLTKTLQGETQFYLVGGEAGVGKSRLVDEIRTQALLDGLVVLRGEGVEGGGLPFQFWRTIARRLLLIAPVSDFQASVLKEIVPDIEKLIERTVDIAPYMSGGSQQQRLAMTIAEIVKSVDLPILLILEDLHCAAESLLPLQHLLKLADQIQHLIVVATYRNDERPELPNTLSDMVELPLTRLTKSDIAQLTEAMLGRFEKQQKIVDFLARETEGNTLFMVEVLRALAEEAGSIHEIGHATLPPHVLTGNMQDVLFRRLTKMPEHYQTILASAAVVGRQIDSALLIHIYPDIDLQDFLLQGEAISIFDVEENEWRFAHDKLRETVIQNLEPAEKSTQHRLVASALEAIYPDNDDYAEALLEHWHQAGNFAKEFIYLQEVVPHHIRVSAEFATADYILNRAFAQLTEDDPKRLVLLNLQAELYERQGEAAQGLPIAEEAYALAQSLKDSSELADSLNNLGLISYAMGEFEKSRTYFLESYETSQTLADKYRMSISLNNLGRVSWALNEPDQSKYYHEQCLAFRQEIGDKRGMAISCNNLGVIAKNQKELEQANYYYEQCMEISREIGYQQGIWASLTNLGNLAVQFDDFSKADDYLQQSLDIAQTMGEKMSMTQSLINLGKTYIHYKNENSWQWLIQCLALAQNIQATHMIYETIVAIADYFLWQEDALQAAQLIGLVQKHIAANNYVQNRIDEVRPQLETMLSAENLEVELEKGAQLDLDHTVQNLLAQNQ